MGGRQRRVLHREEGGKRSRYKTRASCFRHRHSLISLINWVFLKGDPTVLRIEEKKIGQEAKGRAFAKLYMERQWQECSDIKIHHLDLERHRERRGENYGQCLYSIDTNPLFGKSSVLPKME